MPAGENAAAIATLMTIVFSMVVMGWALLYKCTETTLDPNDFAVQKCFSFLAVPKKENETVTDTIKESTSLFGDNVSGSSIIQTTDIDDDVTAMDPDSYKYMSDFNEMSTKLTAEVYTNVAASDIYNCAKICATNEIVVGKGEDAGECGGFTSEYEDSTPDDKRVTCRLYKKGSIQDTGVRSYSSTSFQLKET